MNKNRENCNSMEGELTIFIGDSRGESLKKKGVKEIERR